MSSDQAPPAGDGLAPRPWEYPAPPGLRDAIAALLPERWGVSLRAARFSSGLVFRFLDETGGLHVLDVRRSVAGTEALLRGEALAFSYREESELRPPLTGRSIPDGYRELLAALAAREQELLPWVVDDAAELAPPVSEATVFLHESELVAAAVRFIGRGGAARAVEHLVEKRVPAGMRGTVHLYLDNACAQACEFCERPYFRKTLVGRVEGVALAASYAARIDAESLGAFDALLDAAGARDPPLALSLTGNDWALHPRLGAMLARLERERRVPVAFYGPSTTLAEPEFAARIAALPTLRGITLTLESPDPEAHDRVTGAAGSGRRVLQAMAQLRALGVEPSINTVLTARVVAELPHLLRWLEAERRTVSLLACFPEGIAARESGAAALPRIDELRARLEDDASIAVSVVEQIIGLPYCAVPPPLRGKLKPLWLGMRREGAWFADGCGACVHRLRCNGVPEGYFRHHGDAGLVAERS